MSTRRRGQLYIAAAAVAWSTAGGLQRELSVDTTTQLAGRAFFAFVALAAFVAVKNRGRTVDAFRSIGVAGLGVAVCTAIASGSFIVALNHATVANVLFLQAVSPIAAALLAWVALGESITGRAAVAMAVATKGVGRAFRLRQFSFTCDRHRQNNDHADQSDRRQCKEGGLAVTARCRPDPTDQIRAEMPTKITE